MKYGDTNTIVLTVRTRGADKKTRLVDLTGTSVRLLATPTAGGDAIELDATVGSSKGTVVHQLTGTLPVGGYHVEIEIDDNGVITHAPSTNYVYMEIEPDLG